MLTLDYLYHARSSLFCLPSFWCNHFDLSTSCTPFTLEYDATPVLNHRKLAWFSWRCFLWLSILKILVSSHLNIDWSLPNNFKADDSISWSTVLPNFSHFNPTKQPLLSNPSPEQNTGAYYQILPNPQIYAHSTWSNADYSYNSKSTSNMTRSPAPQFQRSHRWWVPTVHWLPLYNFK